MPALFSRSCQYALQAVFHLASKPAGQPLHLREISGALRVPHHFLSKILQALARERIVISHKGSSGGFELARSPKEITLGDVVRTIEGPGFLEDCLLGLPQCNEAHPCPLHATWKVPKQTILDMLEKKSVYELTNGFDLILLAADYPVPQSDHRKEE